MLEIITPIYTMCLQSISTLFPYTTLFRSGDLGVVLASAPCDVALLFGGTPDPGPGRPRSEETRLNSSHQIISYAVFCLKKKNSINFTMCFIDLTNSILE